MPDDQKKKRNQNKRSHGTGSLIRRKSGMYYYWTTDATGKRHAKSLRTRNKKEALEKIAEMQRGVTAKDKHDIIYELGKARKIIQERDLPLEEVWQAFLNTNPSASEGTLGNYNRHLKEFLDWLREDRPAVTSFTQVDKSTATAYLEHVWASGVSANTYNYKRNSVGHITKRLANQFGIETNPWEHTDRKREVKQKRKKLNSDQIAKLFELLDDPNTELKFRHEARVLTKLCVFAGTRLNDAVLMQWENIDLTAGKLEYMPIKTASKGKVAQVPILPPLMTELLTLEKGEETEQDYLFPKLAETYKRNSDGVKKPLIQLIQKACNYKRKAEANIRNTGQRLIERSPYGIHSLRHSFASMAAASGAKPAYLARMLGDNIATVDRYYVNVGLGESLLPGFPELPSMTGNRAKEEPERTQLHSYADSLPLAAVKQLLNTAKNIQNTPAE